MKTFQKQEVVQKTYSHTYYRCDFCEFESKDARTVHEHSRATHTFTAVADGAGDCFWFETQDAYDRYIDAEFYRKNIKSWKGPGWYVEVDHGFDACEQTEVSEFPLARDWADHLLRDAGRLLNKAETLRGLPEKPRS